MNADASGWIELKNVCKRYGRQPVFDGASVTIERGEFVAVMGRSGSGKSTLLRLIGGLEAADSGLVRVDDTDLTTLTETERAQRRRRGLGFVFQSFNLIPTLTVAENVELPLALNDVAPDEVRRLRSSLLAELGLADCADRFPEDISGGEQQRVAIAKILAQEPAVVLADEPVASLDLSNGRLVMQTLRRVASAVGITVIATLHHVEHARNYADRILGLKAGRLVFDGPASRLTDAALFEIFGEFVTEPTRAEVEADRELAAS
jgi:ABC-type lipoprotein export system ATPase subunit